MSALNFTTIDQDTFLKDYWQKKPIVLKQAMPSFVNNVGPEELAGLSLEPDVESRIVIEKPSWQLKHGPFSNEDYADLPETHWTLLVQGADRLLPQIQTLLDYFNFIPQWRVDDIMISYAALHGSVGPHYDNYDVFLLQAQGQRKWMLTTQECHEKNYLTGLDLRVMNEFIIEQEFVLDPGDILYLPPHVGHHGVSLSDDCMTYSFGYRSYQGLEMLNNLCDYLSEQGVFNALYKDPSWEKVKNTSELPDTAWKQAQELMQSAIANDDAIKDWFSQFVTSLDADAESRLPAMIDDDNVNEDVFISLLNANNTLQRNPQCKILYYPNNSEVESKLYINGVVWDTSDIDYSLIKLISNQRTIDCEQLQGFISLNENIQFLYKLWKLQWLQFENEIY